MSITVKSRQSLTLVFLMGTALSSACTKKDRSNPGSDPNLGTQNPKGSISTIAGDKTPDPNLQTPAPGQVTPELQAFRNAVVGKIWKACFYTENTSTLIELEIGSNRSWKTTGSTFSGKSCEGKVLSKEVEEGSFTIEAPIRPNVYPVNLTRTGGTPFYEITSLRGDRLHFGRSDDNLNGSTPEKRPIELDTAGYYTATVKPPIIKLDIHD